MLNASGDESAGDEAICLVISNAKVSLGCFVRQQGVFIEGE